MVFFKVYVIQMCITAEYNKLHFSRRPSPDIESNSALSVNHGQCQAKQRPPNFFLGISFKLDCRQLALVCREYYWLLQFVRFCHEQYQHMSIEEAIGTFLTKWRRPTIGSCIDTSLHHTWVLGLSLDVCKLHVTPWRPFELSVVSDFLSHFVRKCNRDYLFVLEYQTI
jgi:hypothetical protein